MSLCGQNAILYSKSTRNQLDCINPTDSPETSLVMPAMRESHAVWPRIPVILGCALLILISLAVPLAQVGARNDSKRIVLGSQTWDHLVAPRLSNKPARPLSARDKR